MSGQTANFDLYVKRLVEVALARENQAVLCFLIEKVISNIFIVHLTDGADIFPHLLREVLRKRIHKPTELLLSKLA